MVTTQRTATNVVGRGSLSSYAPWHISVGYVAFPGVFFMPFMHFTVKTITNRPHNGSYSITATDLICTQIRLPGRRARV